MRFDSCAKLGPSFKGTNYMMEDYCEEMKKNNIDHALITSERPLSYKMSEGNAYIEGILNNGGETFIGAIRLNPWNKEESKKEFERMRNPKFKAFYLNPWEETYSINSRVVEYIFKFADEYEIPIIIEGGFTWVSHISKVADVARKYSRIRFLVLNAGQLDLSGFTLMEVDYYMKNVNNLCIGTNFAVAGEWLSQVNKKSAPGRVLFTTNYPWGEVDLEVKRIEMGFYTTEEREEMFWENPIRFFR